MSEPRLKVRVRCFSHVRDALGRGEIELELPAGATAGDALAAVRALAPARLAELPMKIAVDQSFVAPETPLAGEEEIALIPPVQGGEERTA